MIQRTGGSASFVGHAMDRSDIKGSHDGHMTLKVEKSEDHPEQITSQVCTSERERKQNVLKLEYSSSESSGDEDDNSKPQHKMQRIS